MQNAKRELLKHLEHLQEHYPGIALSALAVRHDPFDEARLTEVIGVDLTNPENFEQALSELESITYDNGYGTQELFGTLWFTDGTWSDRGEYDGSEWWEHRLRPTPPSKTEGHEKE